MMCLWLFRLVLIGCVVGFVLRINLFLYIEKFVGSVMFFDVYLVWIKILSSYYRV